MGSADNLRLYRRAFGTLHVGRAKDGILAPHKPVLLAAVLNEIERGAIRENLIRLCPSLERSFRRTRRQLLPADDNPPRIVYPFRYLVHDGFWELVRGGRALSVEELGHPTSKDALARLIDGARLSPDLWNLLQDPGIRCDMRNVLLDTYFDGAVRTSDNAPQSRDPAVLTIETLPCICTPTYSEEDLPQGRPLLELLDPPSQRLVTGGEAAIEGLGLSTRSINCLEKARITSVEMLLQQTLADLLKIPNMGAHSVTQILHRLNAYVTGSAVSSHDHVACGPMVGRDAAQQPAGVTLPTLDASASLPTNAVYTPTTLRHEWNLFSGAALSTGTIEDLSLTADARGRLGVNGAAALDGLLAWSWDETQARLGTDAAEELLDALVAHAASRRDERPVRREEPTLEAVRATLERRWRGQPVTAFGFGRRTEALLLAAKVACLGDMLAALDPLQPTLRCDLPAFLDVWNRLVDLGLRDGDPQSQWQRLVADSSRSVSLADVAETMRQYCEGRQWAALALRYRLDVDAGAEEAEPDVADNEEENQKAKRTLAQVAQVMHLSRERVRQIESQTCEKLRIAQGGLFTSLRDTLVLLIRQAGGVLSVAQAGDLISSLVPSGQVAAEHLAHLLMDLADDLTSVGSGSIYRLTEIPLERYHQAIGYARQICRDTLVNLSELELAHAATERMVAEGGACSERFVLACLRANGRFNRELPRRDLTFLILETLRRIGKPAHFREITSELNASGWRRAETTENSLHGRLIDNAGLFVYVAPGTYGLAEWGLEDKRVYDRLKNGLIGDIIEEFLIERDEPADVAEIFAHVMARKRCRELSIRQCLLNDGRFLRFQRASYGLKRWVM